MYMIKHSITHEIKTNSFRHPRFKNSPSNIMLAKHDAILFPPCDCIWYVDITLGNIQVRIFSVLKLRITLSKGYKLIGKIMVYD